MPKRKQKALKQKTVRKIRPDPFRTFRRLPLLAGLALALVSIPTGWLLVSAQAVTPTEGVVTDARNSAGQHRPASQPTHASKSHTPTATDAKAVEPQKAAVSAAPSKPVATTAAPQASATQSLQPLPPAPGAFPNGGHDNIITTIFWVGETPDSSNANISNAESAWDSNWQAHYGGFDDPVHRSGYNPAAFVAKENPFYAALPYNDLDDSGNRKANAGNCPNAGGTAQSWCKNSWIKITKGSKNAYAQWQDVGPIQEDDAAYVFGTSRPKNTWDTKAGLDVSPATRDYLGLQDVDLTSWSFVSASSVPAGPWKNVVTTSQGGWQ